MNTEAIILSRMVSPGEDFYLHNYAFRWYRLVEDGHDLSPEEAGETSVCWDEEYEKGPVLREEPARKEPSELDLSRFQWIEANPSDDPVRFDVWHEVFQEVGLAGMLNIPWAESRWLKWALETGLLPGQEFLVACSRPQWVNCGTYEEPNETDFEFEAGVVRVLPPQSGLRSLEQTIDNLVQHRRIIEEHRETLRRAQVADTSRMFLRFEPYFAPGDRHWDDMAMPSGICVWLCTTRCSLEHPERHGYSPLFSARDDEGSSSRAIERLQETLGAQHPELPPLVKSLRQG